MKRAYAIGLLLTASVSWAALAQTRAPQMERIKDGILMHAVPRDAIRAIDDPVFVTAEEADKFMSNNEPVLGLYDGEVAKAYSLWHLDRHEIVNDSLPGLGPVAVTW